MVVATEVLKHLSEAERRCAVRELVRVGKHHLLATVPYRETLEAGMGVCARCETVFHFYGHTRSFTHADLAILDSTLGIELLEAIVPIREVRPLKVLRWLRMKCGSNYGFDPSVRCPACGGPARADSGNVIGSLRGSPATSSTVPYLDGRPVGC